MVDADLRRAELSLPVTGAEEDGRAYQGAVGEVFGVGILIGEVGAPDKRAQLRGSLIDAPVEDRDREVRLGSLTRRWVGSGAIEHPERADRDRTHSRHWAKRS